MNFETSFLFFTLLYMLCGYLLGSISTAIITCKLMNLPDPRSVGSNNPGATNVLRHGGKKAAIITLFGDMLKGLLPVVIVSSFEPGASAAALTGAGALLGHIYPVYYDFRGGKGVATFYGALLGFNWAAGLTALAIWWLAALITDISSLSALISILISPYLAWLLSGSMELTVIVALMAVLIYWRHRSNIRNIIQGKENRIGPKPE